MDKKCEELLETLRTVPTNLVLKLFKEASNNLDGLPEDREILKYYRAHMAPQSRPSEAPQLTYNGDHGFLDSLAEKYPAFYDVIQAIKLRPDAYMPDEIQKKVLQMLANPKNFLQVKENEKT